MKRLVLLAVGLLGSFSLFAQDRIPVTFKVVPSDYEVFVSGDRLTYSLRGDGLRTYLLPAGTQRVNLTADGAAPLSLTVEVKTGALVQAKLEPRGALQWVAEAGTGKLPRNLAFSADGKRLVVALQGEPGLDVYEVPSLKKLDRLAPAQAAATGYADVALVGKELWAVQRDGSVHIFDGTTLAFVQTVSLPRGGNLSLLPLGPGRVAISDGDNSLLTLFDTAEKTGASVSLPGSLRGFGAGTSQGYAALFDRAQIAVVDLSTGARSATWSVGKAPRPVAVLGNRIFVGDMGAAQVLVLDSQGKLVSSVPVASNPHQMATSADRTLVAVASRGRNNPVDYQLAGPEYGKVTVLNAQGGVVASVWGRNQPTGLAFSPDGRFLAFTDFLDNNVELYRLTL